MGFCIIYREREIGDRFGVDDNFLRYSKKDNGYTVT